jgi:hypothetical protein
MLVLRHPSTSEHGVTHSADCRGHPLDRSSRSPIPPRTTKKSCSDPLRWPPRPSLPAPRAPGYSAAIPRARTHPAPHNAAPRPLRLRAALTPSSAGHPLCLWSAIHSASVCPTLPPRGHPSRPSTAARPIRSQPSRPRRAPPPPPRHHQEKIIVGETSSPAVS